MNLEINLNLWVWHARLTSFNSRLTWIDWKSKNKTVLIWKFVKIKWNSWRFVFRSWKRIHHFVLELYCLDICHHRKGEFCIRWVTIVQVTSMIVLSWMLRFYIRTKIHRRIAEKNNHFWPERLEFKSAWSRRLRNHFGHIISRLPMTSHCVVECYKFIVDWRAPVEFIVPRWFIQFRLSMFLRETTCGRILFEWTLLKIDEIAHCWARYVIDHVTICNRQI
jgi:hypothetical protein